MTDKNFFYTEPISITNDEFSLSKEESHHAHKVLRLNVGDRIWLIDGQGCGFQGELLSYNGLVRGKILKSFPMMGENSWDLQIVIGVLNKKRMELLVEKATELGVNKFSFVKMDNSNKQKIQFSRLEKIIKIASKQCGRTKFPMIKDYKSLNDYFGHNNKDAIAAHKSGKFFLNTLLLRERKNISTIIIGPEGDFSNKELDIISNNNIPIVSFGARRLRAETAGIYGLISINEYNLNKNV